MTSPNARIVQSDATRRRQAERDLSGLPWGNDRANRVSVRLAKAVIFGLTPICFMAWLVAGKHL